MIFVKCAGHLTTSFSIIDLKEQLCIYLKTYTQTFRLHAMIIPLGFASKSSVYQSFQWYHILGTFFGQQIGQTISSKTSRYNVTGHGSTP